MRILLPVLFFAPIVEIYLLIRLGGYIGAWPAVAEVLLTALLGLLVLRRQGGEALRRAMLGLQRGEFQVAGLVEGFLLTLAGLLLLVPGLITDCLGLVLLVPACRRAAARRLLRGALEQGPVFQQPGADATVIEGEFERLDSDTPDPRDPQ